MNALPLALLLTLASNAPEQTKSSPEAIEQAKALFRAAAKAYKSRNYPVAITAFEAAYRSAPTKQIVFAMAQAYRMQYLTDNDPLKLKRATELYQEYLERFPNENRQKHARQHKKTLEPILEQIKATRPEALEPKQELKVRTMFMVSSNIETARVLIDDQEITDFPDSLEVEPGDHEIKFEAPGYLTKTFTAQAPAGSTIPLDVDLKELPGKIRISAPDGADVYIDGTFLGEAPFSRAVEVKAGAHFIAITQTGSYPFSQEVTVDRGEEASVVAKLESTSQRTVAWIFLTSSGVLAVTSALGIAGAIGHQAEAKRLESTLDQRGLTVEEANQHTTEVNKRSDNRMVAGVAGIAAIIGAAAGILLFVMDDPRPPSPRIGSTDQPQPTLSLLPAASPEFSGAVLSASF